MRRVKVCRIVAAVGAALIMAGSSATWAQQAIAPPVLPQQIADLRLTRSDFRRFNSGGRAGLMEYADAQGQVRLRMVVRWIETAEVGATQASLVRSQPTDGRDHESVLHPQRQLQTRLWLGESEEPSPAEAAQATQWLVAATAAIEPMIRDLALRAHPWPAGYDMAGHRVLGRVRAVRGEVWVRDWLLGQRIVASPGLIVLHGDMVETDAGSAIEIDASAAFEPFSTAEGRQAMRQGFEDAPRYFNAPSPPARLWLDERAICYLFDGMPIQPLVLNHWQGWALVSLRPVWPELWRTLIACHSFHVRPHDADLLIDASANLGMTTYYLTRGGLSDGGQPAAGMALADIAIGHQITAVNGRADRPLASDPQVVSRQMAQARRLGRAQMPQYVARLVAAVGPVTGVRSDGKHYTIRQGDWLMLDQSFETGSEGSARLEITTPDTRLRTGLASAIDIGPRSSVRVRRRGVIGNLIDGLVRWVSGAQGPSPALIRAGFVTVEIHGTDFIARYDRSTRRGELLLGQGSIVVRHDAGGPPVVMRPGQRLSFSQMALEPSVAMASGEYDRAARSVAAGFAPPAGPADAPTRPQLPPHAAAGSPPPVFPSAPSQPALAPDAPDPFAPVVVQPDIAAPVAPAPPPPSSDNDPFSRIRWMRVTSDSRFTLDVPEGWLAAADASKAVWLYDPAEPLQSASVIVNDASGEADLSAAIDRVLEQSRQARPDLQVERTKAPFAGVPAELMFLRMVLAPENRTIVVAAYTFLADGRLWMVQAQCPAEQINQRRELLGRIISSFAFTQPRGQSDF